MLYSLYGFEGLCNPQNPNTKNFKGTFYVRYISVLTNALSRIFMVI